MYYYFFSVAKKNMSSEALSFPKSDLCSKAQSASVTYGQVTKNKLLVMTSTLSLTSIACAKNRESSLGPRAENLLRIAPNARVCPRHAQPVSNSEMGK